MFSVVNYGNLFALWLNGERNFKHLLASLAAGEVGKVGVAIDSLDDMLTLLDGIPLDTVSTSMTINATASTLLCLYLAVAKRQNVAFDQVNGTIQNDILKECIARRTYIYPPQFIKFRQIPTDV
jgi:methylmalonyl-CoA mutase N-terminal domain/subunit